MRRFGPIALVVLLLLLAGWVSGIGIGSRPPVFCNVGCILDVYPCIDPVTNKPPVLDDGSGCLAPGSTTGLPPADVGPFPRGIATSALSLALAGLALLIGVWWWLDRRRSKAPPDAYHIPPGDQQAPSSAALPDSAIQVSLDAPLPVPPVPPSASVPGAEAPKADAQLPDAPWAALPPKRRSTTGDILVFSFVILLLMAAVAAWLLVPSLAIPSSQRVGWQLNHGFGGLAFDPTTAQTTTVIPIEVERPGCAPAGTSWLADPVVTYTPWSVTITMHTTDAFGDVTKCYPRDSTGRSIVGWYLSGTYFPVHLSQPLWGRALFDGSQLPPAARPYPGMAEASAAAEAAAARASAAAALAPVRASAAAVAAAVQASAEAVEAAAEASAAAASCSIGAADNAAMVIVEGDGSQAACDELARTIDLGSGRRLGDLRQPADPPSGNLLCRGAVGRFEVSVYDHDSGSASQGAVACRYIAPTPYLGMVVEEVDQGLRLRSTSGPTGRVPAVYPGGPAAKAGLQAGDVITRIDDAPNPTASVMDEIVAAHRIGDTLHLEVLRSGLTLSVDLVLEARPPTY